jgi:hypothetical protein
MSVEEGSAKLRELGYEPPKESTSEERRKDDKADVLEALSRGEISIDDAANVIGKWQKGDKKKEDGENG